MKKRLGLALCGSYCTYETLFQAAEKLKEDYAFSTWQKMDEDTTAVRFCTGWAATEEQIDALLSAIPFKK